MEKIQKVKIVNKSKMGVQITLKKNGEPVFMAWKEFDERFIVQDKVWAVATRDFKQKLEEAHPHFETARKALLGFANVTDEAEKEEHYNTLMNECDYLSEVIGVKSEEVFKDFVAHANRSEKKYKAKTKKKAKKEQVVKPKKEKETCNTFAVLADNPVLSKLKHGLM